MRTGVDTSDDHNSVKLADDESPTDSTRAVTNRRRPAAESSDEPEGDTLAAGHIERSRGPRSKGHRALKWLIAVPIALLVAILAAWGIDTAMSSDQVARNTELAGEPVGGMTRSELEDAVAELAAKLPDTPVSMDTGEFTLDSTAGALGIGIDTAATSDAVWETGRSESLWRRPVEWVRSFGDPRSAAVVVDVDEPTMTAALATLEGDRRAPAVEPSLSAQESAVVLVPGVDGTELTAAAVIDALPDTLGDVTERITVKVERTVTPPVMPDTQIQALVDQANGILGSKITVVAGEQRFELDGAGLVGGFVVDDSTGSPRLSISPEAIAQQLAAQEPELAANPTGVRFDIQGGTPVAVAGHDAEICCGEGAAQLIVDALLNAQSEVSVPTRTLSAAEGVEWAQGLGVKEVIGEFSTPHKCCESRVTNIHRISDLTRGVLIPPGATFSVNDFVGKRTTEKGFVEGGVIENGEFTTDIGGGVSQFATTLFNAAFFGGLDIPQYKMHSKYISRYPFGREATLAYPSVDLKIHNQTPYGVVIWPTYTDTSVNVQLWSTRYATGAQTSQSQSSGCGSVTTERTRTFLDGTTDTDTFKAAYDCD
jgi:vancomycin resistance protein YoaR